MFPARDYCTIFMLCICLSACAWWPKLPQVNQMQPIPVSLADATDVMQGVCFEAALALADEPIVLRSTLELIRFFDRIDQSGDCRRAIQRASFEFSGGRALVGMWSYGAGCTAAHELLQAQRDAANAAIEIRLRFTTDGDCPYELIRPYWVGIDDAAGYSIVLEIGA